jgi:lipopolysaccharide/colanic/teichoic acid biosynthesis glycosyltransferase
LKNKAEEIQVDGGLGPAKSAAKAVFDTLVAAVLLLALAPVLLGCAALIKCASGGEPVLETEARLDHRGTAFELLRFRIPAGGRVGALIEKHNLNHLPELLNVLRGDMSLVGPRPRTLHKAHDVNPGLRPGLTGLWSLSTGTSEEWPDIERRYARTWSIGGDIAILARTIAAVRYKL